MREHVRSGTEAVDGLRGIAILLVLVYHTYLFSWLTPEFAAFGIQWPVDVYARDGYLGVDLFFAISGFVLGFPHALRALGADVRVEGLRDFARRRFVKIVPSYALALIATLAVSAAYLDRKDLAVNALTHALFVQNAFPTGLGKANSVFWSLAIEVQFYLIFPLVARAFRTSPFATAVALCTIAFVYRHAVSTCCLGDETIVRELPAYLDLFACGMFAAYCVAYVRVRRLRVPAAVFTLGAALCAYGAFRLMQSADTVQYVALGPQRWDLIGRTFVAIAAGGLIACSCLALRAWRVVLANPFFVFCGVVSYNVYLWHTLLMIWMWQHGVPRAATPNPHDDPHWKTVYIASGWAITFAVSTAVTYFIERPLLGTIKPQTFAFRWSRLRAAAGPPETRTLPSRRDRTPSQP